MDPSQDTAEPVIKKGGTSGNVRKCRGKDQDPQTGEKKEEGEGLRNSKGNTKAGGEERKRGGKKRGQKVHGGESQHHNTPAHALPHGGG